MSLRDDFVKHLEEENEQLRERIAALEEQLGLRLEVPPPLGLTPKEGQIFGMLLKRELVSKQHAMTQLYGLDPEGGADDKIVDVFICKLRAKLKRFDLSVETQWGIGYFMRPAAKAKASALIAQLTATEAA